MSNVDIHSEIKKNANQLEKVIEILKSRPEMAKVKNRKGSLPLHIAMEYGGKGVFDLVKVLVKLHPEGIKTKNYDGNLPIHIMEWSSLGHGEAGNKSLRTAHKFLLKEYPEGSKIQNNKGELPIHCAAENCHLPTVQLLLQVFPEGSKVEDKHGNLPIHHACDWCRDTDDMVQLVVQLADAYPEGLQHKDKEGRLPIDISVMKRKTRVIRSLQNYDEEKLERFEQKKSGTREATNREVL
jgi:ankyrin repeat protein